MKYINDEANKLYEKHLANKKWIRTVAVATLVILLVIVFVQ